MEDKDPRGPLGPDHFLHKMLLIFEVKSGVGKTRLNTGEASTCDLHPPEMSSMAEVARGNPSDTMRMWRKNSCEQLFDRHTTVHPSDPERCR